MRLSTKEKNRLSFVASYVLAIMILVVCVRNLLAGAEDNQALPYVFGIFGVVIWIWVVTERWIFYHPLEPLLDALEAHSRNLKEASALAQSHHSLFCGLARDLIDHGLVVSEAEAVLDSDASRERLEDPSLIDTDEKLSVVRNALRWEMRVQLMLAACEHDEQAMSLIDRLSVQDFIRREAEIEHQMSDLRERAAVELKQFTGPRRSSERAQSLAEGLAEYNRLFREIQSSAMRGDDDVSAELYTNMEALTERTHRLVTPGPSRLNQPVRMPTRKAPSTSA